MSTAWVYVAIIVAALAAAFIAVQLLGRMGRKERAVIKNEQVRIDNLPIDQARVLARRALDDELIFRSVRASSPLRTVQNLGPLTQEFFETYERVESANGAIVIGRGEIRPSEYDRGFTTVGRSDYLDVVVQPSQDSVSEIDSSESPEDRHESSPSIYHWIVRAASDLDPQRNIGVDPLEESGRSTR
jgi:hypothetical protein